MSLVENERIKLLANAFDRASTACFTVGVLAPLAAAVYTTGVTEPDVLVFVAAAIVWLLVGAALHLLARRTLGGLTQ
jgi:cobalamin synthase